MKNQQIIAYISIVLFFVFLVIMTIIIEKSKIGKAYEQYKVNKYNKKSIFPALFECTKKGEDFIVLPDYYGVRKKIDLPKYSVLYDNKEMNKIIEEDIKNLIKIEFKAQL